VHTTKLQESDRSIFMDKDTGQEMEVVDQTPFLEWLAEKYRDFGAALEFVSDRSSEGNQFVKGFGGIGSILRYKVNFEQLADYDDDDEFYDDDEDSSDWRFSTLAVSEANFSAPPHRFRFPPATVAAFESMDFASSVAKNAAPGVDALHIRKQMIVHASLTGTARAILEYTNLWRRESWPMKICICVTACWASNHSCLVYMRA